MANSPISAFDLANPISDADIIPIVQDVAGTLDNFKVGMATLRTYFQSTLPTDISNNTSRITTNEGDIASLQGNVSTLQGDVTTLGGRVTTNEGDIATNQGNITANQGAITTVQGDVTAIGLRVTTNEGDISTLQSDATTLAGRVTVNEGDITTAQGDIVNLQAETSGYTQGSVIFADTDGTFTEDNTTFKWDDNANVLIIGGDFIKIHSSGEIDAVVSLAPIPEVDRAKMFVKNSNGTDGIATWTYIDEDGYTHESRESSLRPLPRMQFDKNVGKTNLTELFGGERIEKLEFNSVNVIETIDFAVRKNLTSSNGTALFQTVTGANTADKLTNLNNWIMGGASIGTETAPTTNQDFQLLITCNLYTAWEATGFVKIEVRNL